MTHEYDYLIVGAGLFGSIVANRLREEGYAVLVVEKRNHVGGTVYTENVDGIHVHKYGAHIFRTSDKVKWDYMNSFGEFNHYVHCPIAVYKDEVYNLPFNMNTFSKLWGIRTPEEAVRMMQSQIVPCKYPDNLEDYILSKVGRDVYEKLIKGYTEKQWGVSCRELPISTMNRIPIRLTYNNNYYDGKPYQGVPKDGYTAIIENMLYGVDVRLNTDGKQLVQSGNFNARHVIYTGCIDEFFDYRFGKLGYRTLRFEEERLPMENYQGNSVVNFTERTIPYTRIIEHKHFTGIDTPFTIITREYPASFTAGAEPFYPMLNEKNHLLYAAYSSYAQIKTPNITFCGKLGSYRYTDMEETVSTAFALLNTLK